MDDKSNESISTTSDYESVDKEQKKPLSSLDIESNESTKTQEKFACCYKSTWTRGLAILACLSILFGLLLVSLVRPFEREIQVINGSNVRIDFFEKQLHEAMKTVREETKEEIRQLKAQNSLLYEKISELISQFKEVEQRQKLMFAESMHQMEKKIVQAVQRNQTDEKPQNKKSNEELKKESEVDVQIPPANCSYFCLFLHGSRNVMSDGFYYFRYPFNLIFCERISTIFAACTLALIFASLIELIIAKVYKPFGVIFAATVILVSIILLLCGYFYFASSIQLCFTGKTDFDFS
ncbi:hypothetical protein M3Y94_00656400 [Aphelenchoides besseyi]|nr:hypothetical protein M3Y94_00656400 [Aphelenchoides besseyi]